MSKLLGLIDVLESIIDEAKSVPLSTKVIVDEQEILAICEKIREVIKSEEVIENTIEVKDTQQGAHSSFQTDVSDKKKDVSSTDEWIKEELKKIKKIKNGADDYAEYVLSNLQLTVTKMQNNLIKLEKNIESGRKVIEEKNELNKSSSEYDEIKET